MMMMMNLLTNIIVTGVIEVVEKSIKAVLVGNITKKVQRSEVNIADTTGIVQDLIPLHLIVGRKEEEKNIIRSTL